MNDLTCSILVLIAIFVIFCGISIGSNVDVFIERNDCQKACTVYDNDSFGYYDGGCHCMIEGGQKNITN